MRIPDWTPEQLAQPKELLDAIFARRGGKLLNLDKALLWSEPVAAGWNVYMFERVCLPRANCVSLAFVLWRC